jgi:hypothetical protein
VLIFLLLIVEILTFIVLRDFFYEKSRINYFFFTAFNSVLTIWLWILVIEAKLYKGIFDMPVNVWILMNLTGMIFAVVAPRILLIIFHFSGKIKQRTTGGFIRSRTWKGLIISSVIFLIIAVGSLIGRFNFRTEEVTIRIEGLPRELDGLKIIHFSDLHLVSFYHHHDLLEKLIERVNSYKPDLIINSGDFINYGWREFDRFDTILVKAVSRLGNFAVVGNHDIGTYHPHFTEADREHNILIMNKLIKASGYTILNNEFKVIEKGNTRIAIIGVITMGQFPDIIFGDLQKATEGLDSADLKILIMHDPNQWEKDVRGKTDIQVTLAGHTHGFQLGVLTKRVKWSPAKFFYPHWHGLYKEGDQYLYVNRGLGVLAIPFRIWMPPEITLIKITSGQHY